MRAWSSDRFPFRAMYIQHVSRHTEDRARNARCALRLLCLRHPQSYLASYPFSSGAQYTMASPRSTSCPVQLPPEGGNAPSLHDSLGLLCQIVGASQATRQQIEAHNERPISPLEMQLPPPGAAFSPRHNTPIEQTLPSHLPEARGLADDDNSRLPPGRNRG